MFIWGEAVSYLYIARFTLSSGAFLLSCFLKKIPFEKERKQEKRERNKKQERETRKFKCA